MMNELGPMVFLSLIPALIAVVVPLVLTIWVLWLSHRAVRALESIADSLRQPRN